MTDQEIAETLTGIAALEKSAGKRRREATGQKAKRDRSLLKELKRKLASGEATFDPVAGVL